MSGTLPLTVAISGKHYTELRQHLFPGDGKEAVAIALCGRSSNSRRDSLLVRELVIVPHEKCRVRTPGLVSWPTDFAIPLLTRAMNEDLAVIKIHSHPTGYPWFSATDDASDQDLFGSIFGWLNSEAPLASLIMLPDGSLIGRAMRVSGIGEPLSNVRVAGEDFLFWRNRTISNPTPDEAIRICQAFGDKTYQTLRAMRVGVVGCSGTGSIVIEQLSRYGIGELVLVDPDRVEDKNLNRIVNSTKADAACSASKTDVMARAIALMGLGTSVIKHSSDLLRREVVRDLASCDILFGCVDSVDGRYLMNKIATYYLIPYIDLGVRIDADGLGGVNHVSGVIHTLQPGGSSLSSRGVYSSSDLTAAFLLRNDPERYRDLRKQGGGYVKDVVVERPAVISVNMQVAASAVNEMLARLLPFRMQPNADYAIRRIQISDPLASCDETDGPSCPQFYQFVGLGDQKPLLGMPKLDETTSMEQSHYA